MNDEKCRFMQDDGWCRILDLGRTCSGQSEHCAFRKTEKEFNEARDSAIDICRKKGLCDKCRYMPVTRRCTKSTEG